MSLKVTLLCFSNAFCSECNVQTGWLELPLSAGEQFRCQLLFQLNMCFAHSSSECQALIAMLLLPCYLLALLLFMLNFLTWKLIYQLFPQFMPWCLAHHVHLKLCSVWLDQLFGFFPLQLSFAGFLEESSLADFVYKSLWICGLGGNESLHNVNRVPKD